LVLRRLELALDLLKLMGIPALFLAIFPDFTKIPELPSNYRLEASK